MVPVDSLAGRTAANRATARVALPGRAVLETPMAAAVTRTIQSDDRQRCQHKGFLPEG